MRISDWSSDVCSSDLAGGVGAQEAERDPLLARPAQRHQAVRHLLEAGAVALSQQFDVVAGRHRVGMEAVIRENQGADRKSAGSGKSVSVRVASGGRRTMNKKNKKKNQAKTNTT